VAFTYLKVKSAKCLFFRWSWYFGLGIGLKNLVLFTSLPSTDCLLCSLWLPVFLKCPVVLSRWPSVCTVPHTLSSFGRPLFCDSRSACVEQATITPPSDAVRRHF